ncbi:hypothetical protein [Sulfurospirillum multivorans]|uniref:Uncharacterized protein n=2 Tax=Sulfurospirillum multivorans TaxID=66821 RepID=A0AA86AL27_SULMK|nr:hypothetical protein [Sulfurospirillum multivorans]AHJ12586.1 hypothetical protein SMUL_1325 [Sulfurospirillum multivorans DSM 12446]QEH06081.1 hypothetical protein SMN_1310 [Sulfurospirillum multivorans]
MSHLFLISPEILMQLVGIRDNAKFIYELVENQTEFNKEISLRTFKNFMKGKGNPSQKTIDVLQKDFKIDFESDIFKGLYNSQWHEILQKIQTTFSKDFFPYAMLVLQEIAKQEDELIQRIKECDTELERIQALAFHPFVLKILNEQENLVLQNAKSHKEIKMIVALLVTKILFYIVAAFDVEYGLYHQKIHKEEQYSFIKKILPVYNDKKEFLHPIGRFFMNIKVKNKKTFKQMAECINVEGYEGIKSESQIRKFKYWRKGTKIPHVDEVINMIKALFPQISTDELEHGKVMFYCVVGVLTLFKELLSAIFKNESELIGWLHKHYNQYHQAHYSACLTKHQTS